MRKNKLKVIEAYIYAKTMFLISANTKIETSNKIMGDFVCSANVLSKKLLNVCEEKIKKHKMFDSSFLLLKQNLESGSYNKGFLTNYTTLCKMIKEYSHYSKIMA